ncbi:Uu.00g083540.m01.CDS01 [Anthostomella pinea]|uniref:Uu.00g083540.m01.CDS01 n=1 Tax=Anthostomella pinea TaxID=933095 RepID=A0AAI8VLN5_9PEZI|nr:Uu.00g083540.m01.CDS01 [Anthostomella pinea]
MNLATALGLYCAVSKEVEGSKLVFPENKTNYLAFNTWTSSKVHAEFCLWAGKAPNAKNQRFNVVNGDTQSWQDLWPRMAARFGCNVPEKMFPTGDAEKKAYPGYSTATKLHPRPLVKEVETKMGLKDEFKPEMGQSTGSGQGVGKPRDRHGLDEGAWDHATWGFLTFLLGREYSCDASMGKARKIGWTGYADTWEEFQRTFKELEAAKMLPPVAELKGNHP